ncbi:MAG: hypothetical protein U5K29_00720 [Acidimicrobiales bacterium]|nr:hypothetical protein [Acidimicrobiales bacterium]
MGRERSGQLLVTLGLIVAVTAALVAGATAMVRSTPVVERAAPELLEVPAIRSAVTAEFERSIQAAYAPETVPADDLAVASERMAQNGYVVDDFEMALAEAHRGWLTGDDLAVQLDPRIITQAAERGLRDADVALADRFPTSALVDPAPVPSPWDVTAGSTAALLRVAVLAVLAGFALFVAGAVLDPRTGSSLKALARAVVASGLLLVVGAVVLPLEVLRSIDARVAVLGAVLGTQLVPLLVIAALLIFLGLSLHATADQVVRNVRRTIRRSRRAVKQATPVPSGARPVRHGSARRREAAIDAFFDQTGNTIHARDPEDAEDRAEAVPVEGEGADAEEHAEDLTPEERRARQIAAERREALERIDGARGPNRTHLPR